MTSGHPSTTDTMPRFITSVPAMVVTINFHLNCAIA